MPGAKAYVLGRRFERTVRTKLERHGFTVLRTAQSRGFADLIVVGKAVWFLQLKTIRTPYLGEARLLRMWREAQGVVPEAVRSSFVLVVRQISPDGRRSNVFVVISVPGTQDVEVVRGTLTQALLQILI